MTEKIAKEEKAEEQEKVSWIKMKPAEIEKIVIELAEKKNSPAKIGITLRDKYGIPKARLLGKKITKILKGANIKYITEKEIVGKRVGALKTHIDKHKQDKNALRSLTKKLWALQKLPS